VVHQEVNVVEGVVVALVAVMAMAEVMVELLLEPGVVE